jgi:ADP-heptose:LPS heptosyltransferase/predicted SAM-dependent methyltransferase
MISIIIPTFGDNERVTKLKDSVRKHEAPFHEAPISHMYEFIVVNDNPKKEMMSVINNEKNLGFAASVNKGMAAAKGDIILLLNDDITITAPFIDTLNEAFKDPDLGIAGALLVYPNGSIQHGGMAYNEKLGSFLHIKSFNRLQSRYCIAVTGAFFAIRRELYNKIGGLDERFFLACEDTKYCLDAWDAGYTVKFFKELTAIHEEGATRGNTPKKKKDKPEWTEAEAKGIKEFKAQLDLSKIREIEKKVKKLNAKNLKIEVGSGYNPQPGYLHLDIRGGLPQLDYICDFVKQRLPFNDGEVSEILANHVIEHIPFRKLPFVISEWARVLTPGGRLVLRTPNLRFICEQYLKGETTPEWPGDEKFIKENLSDSVTPAWWANLKLFSGQDYDANFHHVCFDAEMLRDLLGRYGFTDGRVTDLGKEYSPGELQFESFKAEPREICLLKRLGALGDVILTTPIVERLHKEGYDVYIDTMCPQVFTNNPYVKGTYLNLDKKPKPVIARRVDLDLAYEKNPKMHIIDAYSLEAFGDTKTPHETNLYVPNYLVSKNNFIPYIVLHMGNSWENRTWSKEYWKELLKKLLYSGEKIIIVGSKDDFRSESSSITNLVGKQTFHELAETIRNAKLFIGIDSAPFHIAEAVDTPAIGIFTCANPEFRSTKKSTLPVVPDIDCKFCLHEEKPPVTWCGCKRGDFKCLEIITPDMIYEKYLEMKV